MDGAFETYLTADLAPFCELLSRLCNPDAIQRTQAESIFNSLRDHRPDGLVAKLLQVLREGSNSELRVFSATLLRQVLAKDHPTLWPSIPEKLQEFIKTELLSLLTTETDHNVSEKVRNLHRDELTLEKVSDLVAELFSKIIGEEYWPELMPYVLNGIESVTSTELTLSCVQMLSVLSPVLIDSLENSIPRFIHLMKQCLSHEELKIKLASLKAIQSFAIGLQDAGEVSELKVLMHEVMVAFQSLQGSPMESTEAHAVLIELAGYVPAVFEEILEPVLTEFLSRSRDPSQDVENKTMALEFILTLIEGIPSSQIDRFRNLIREFLSILMECLLQIEDVSDWYVRTGGNQESPDFGDIHDLGVASVDRLASAIPGRIFLELFEPYLEHWSADQDWKKRHGVLTVLGQMAEGCSNEITDKLLVLLELCSTGLVDSSLRVRWAACQALGLISDEVGGLFERVHRDEMISRLIQSAIVQDLAAASVHEHALRCLLNLLQSSEHPLNGTMLDQVIKWILQSVQFDHKGVAKAALDCLMCVATLLETPCYAKYYDETMKCVFGILDRFKDPNHLIEMSEIIHVGVASGKECFDKDVQFLMEFLQQLSSECKKLDDLDDGMNVQINVLNSIGNISIILKHNLSLLEFIKTNLLEALSTEPKFEKISPEELEDLDDEDVPLVIGDMAFSIERMSLALLTCGMKNSTIMAENMEYQLFPILIPILERFMSAMDYHLNKEVREMGIQGQPILLKCAISVLQVEDNENHRSFISTLLNKQWDELLNRLGDLTEESQQSVISTVLDSMSKIIEVIHCELDASMLQKVFAKLERVFQFMESIRVNQQQQQQQQQPAASEDPLGQELEDLSEEENLEQEILSSVESLFAAVMKNSNDQFYQWIEVFFPSIQKLLLTLKDSEETDFGSLEIILTIMTDICEFSKLGREKHGADICQLFLQKLSHESAKIKHISAFGIGLVAQMAPDVFPVFIGPSLRGLTQELNALSRSKLDPDFKMAKDNIISAIWKILSSFPNKCTNEDAYQLFQLCLSHLPLSDDLDEAFLTHESFLMALESQNERILGSGREKLERCIDILMEILASDVPLASSEVLKRMSILLKSLENENGCDTIARKKLQEWTPEKQQQFNIHMTSN
eukprot:g7024.t1